MRMWTSFTCYWRDHSPANIATYERNTRLDWTMGPSRYTSADVCPTWVSSWPSVISSAIFFTSTSAWSALAVQLSLHGITKVLRSSPWYGCSYSHLRPLLPGASQMFTSVFPVSSFSYPIPWSSCSGRLASSSTLASPTCWTSAGGGTSSSTPSRFQS